MLTITAPAVPDIRQARARALCVAGGALAAALAWTVEVPLLGIDLNFRYGTSHTQIVAAGQVIGASLAALLLGWLLLAVLEQHTAYARTLWTSLALAGLAASVALPLTVATTAATTPAAVVGLVVLHLTIGAAAIPAMARTARARRQRTRTQQANAQRRRQEQITQIRATTALNYIKQASTQIGGSRAGAANSDCHAARPAFRNVSDLIDSGCAGSRALCRDSAQHIHSGYAERQQFS